jgi:hypothetical protein
MGLPTLFRQLSTNCLGLTVAAAGFCGSGAADPSEVALGGAPALAGADFARSFALGASSTLAVAGFGCDLAIAAWAHAWTRGLACSRQASMLPPPPRMHAIMAGLPTLLRHASIA